MRPNSCRPWWKKATPGSEGTYFTIISGSDGGGHAVARHVIAFDADLICAAPDMRDAIAFAIAITKQNDPEAWPEAMEYLEAALAKADGK